MLLRYPENKVAEIKFGKMRNHFLKMTRKCERLQDLKSLSADCFVTGSDQVWGPTMNGDFDEAYFCHLQVIVEKLHMLLVLVKLNLRRAQLLHTKDC